MIVESSVDVEMQNLDEAIEENKTGILEGRTVKPMSNSRLIEKGTSLCGSILSCIITIAGGVVWGICRDDLTTPGCNSTIKEKAQLICGIGFTSTVIFACIFGAYMIGPKRGENR